MPIYVILSGWMDDNTYQGTIYLKSGNILIWYQRKMYLYLRVNQIKFDRLTNKKIYIHR